MAVGMLCNVCNTTLDAPGRCDRCGGVEFRLEEVPVIGPISREDSTMRLKAPKQVEQEREQKAADDRDELDELNDDTEDAGDELPEDDEDEEGEDEDEDEDEDEEEDGPTAPPSNAVPVDLDADEHHRAAVSAAETRLAKCTLARVRAKQSYKVASEAEKVAAEELEDLLTHGPQRLPLFDKPAATPSSASTVAPPTPVDQSNLPPEAVNRIKVKLLLSQYDPDDEELWHAEGEVVDAYNDEKGDVFLARQREEDDAWIYIDLDEDRDFEPVVEQIEVTESPADDNTWRAVSIESLGIPAGVCKILREDNSISTLGQIADWTSSGKYLTDLAKVGEAKAEKIEQACDRYWAKAKAKAGGPAGARAAV